MALTDRDCAMLELERSWFRYPGARETAVRERFDMSLPRYLQVLGALIDTPEALAYDAQLVRRLRRRRDGHRARSARRGGFVA
ncbi:DUF3263 domain-containing protein [Nocardioides montaniterrae]